MALHPSWASNHHYFLLTLGGWSGVSKLSLYGTSFLILEILASYSLCNTEILHFFNNKQK